MAKSTMKELVEELRKMSQSPTREMLIRLAEKGEFHDYRSSQICGKMYFTEVFQDAMPLLNTEDQNFLKLLRSEVVDGEYDEECTEEDKQFMKNEIDSDPNISERDKAFFKGSMGIV